MEIIIFSEFIQAQKNKYCIFLLCVYLIFLFLDMCIYVDVGVVHVIKLEGKPTMRE